MARLVLRGLIVILMLSSALPVGGVVPPRPAMADATTTLADCLAASLTNAVASAANGDVIVLLVGCTYTFTSASDFSYGPSALAIAKTLTIEGNGATIAATPPITGLRLFMVGSNGNLTLHDVVLRDGVAKGGDGGLGGTGGGGAAGLGGAIVVSGSLSLERVTLTGNQARGGNGGNGTDDRFGGGGGGGFGGQGGQGA